MTAARSPLGSVYVLHFASPYHHVRHYIGFAADSNATRRLHEHLTGQGSPLVAAAVAAGIAVELAEWPGTRADERKAHNAHGTRVCPRCRRPRSRQLRLFTGGGHSAAPTPRRAASWVS